MITTALVAAAILYMINGAFVQWSLYFNSLEILAHYKVTEMSKIKTIIKLWPLLGAIAWPALLWAMRKLGKKK